MQQKESLLESVDEILIIAGSTLLHTEQCIVSARLTQGNVCALDRIVFGMQAGQKWVYLRGLGYL